MNNQPLVSIIVLNYNGQKFIKSCLDSILKTDYPDFEIIFVDNGSQDQSLEIAGGILKNHPHYQVLHTPKNLGWSGGNNFGIKKARGEAIVLLSNDTEVEKNWLKELIRVLYSDEKVGLVQVKSISIFDRQSLDSGKNFIDPYGFCYSTEPEEYPEEVFFAEGVAMAVKKEVFETIGLFDEGFTIMYDDIDLSWRSRIAGYKVMIAPRSIVYHHRGGTVGEAVIKIKPEIIYLNTRNHLTSLMKNYQGQYLLRYLWGVIAAQFIKSFLFLFFHKKPAAFWAIYKGLFSLIFDLQKILAKRKLVKRIRTVSDQEIKKAMVKFKPLLLIKIFKTRKPLGAKTLQKAA